MPVISTITVDSGRVHKIGSDPDRTLIGINVPAMSSTGSYLGFVNAEDETIGYPLGEDAQTVLSSISGSNPRKLHMLKAFGEDITIQILMEHEGEDE